MAIRRTTRNESIESALEDAKQRGVITGWKHLNRDGPRRWWVEAPVGHGPERALTAGEVELFLTGVTLSHRAQPVVKIDIARDEQSLHFARVRPAEDGRPTIYVTDKTVGERLMKVAAKADVTIYQVPTDYTGIVIIDGTTIEP